MCEYILTYKYSNQMKEKNKKNELRCTTTTRWWQKGKKSTSGVYGNVWIGKSSRLPTKVIRNDSDVTQYGYKGGDACVCVCGKPDLDWYVHSIFGYMHARLFTNEESNKVNWLKLNVYFRYSSHIHRKLELYIESKY